MKNNLKALWRSDPFGGSVLEGVYTDDSTSSECPIGDEKLAFGEVSSPLKTTLLQCVDAIHLDAPQPDFLFVRAYFLSY